jgi:hypothetical protein
MKKTLLIISAFLMLTACKNEAKIESEGANAESLDQRAEKQNDGLTLLKGEFIYFSDAAVLQTKDQMYGVVIDDKMHELNNKAEAFKTEVTDFVQVEIRGKVTPKPENEEGWPFRVEIKEIINVEAVEQSSEVVKLGKE